MAGVGRVNKQDCTRQADDGDEPTVELGRRGNSDAAAPQNAFAPGGVLPPVLAEGGHVGRAFRHPRTRPAAPAAADTGSPSYEQLAQRVYSQATFDYLASLADDSNRPAAVRVLDTNRKWLEQRDYRAIDIQSLMARADLAEIVSAFRKHDKVLRDAGFTSTGIVEAARHPTGAQSIDALAARHRTLIEELGYRASQLSRLAFVVGPELIELLADCPRLTRENDGPLGINQLISDLDDGTSGRVLGELYARAAALSEGTSGP